MALKNFGRMTCRAIQHQRNKMQFPTKSLSAAMLSLRYFFCKTEAQYQSKCSKRQAEPNWGKHVKRRCQEILLQLSSNVNNIASPEGGEKQCDVLCTNASQHTHELQASSSTTTKVFHTSTSVPN